MYRPLTSLDKLQSLQKHYGSNNKLAAALGISIRSLQRFLSEEGEPHGPTVKVIDHLFAQTWLQY